MCLNPVAIYCVGTLSNSLLERLRAEIAHSGTQWGECIINGMTFTLHI